MIKDLFSARVARRILSGPYGPWLEDFAGYLQKRGQPLPSLHTYVFCGEHFIRWLGEQQPSPETFDEGTVRQFLKIHLGSVNRKGQIS